MKHLTLLSAALMALALTACNDEPMVEETPVAPEAVSNIDGKYISIKLNNVDNSRGLSDGDINYAVGTANENKIKKGQIHFLFFDIEGNPFTMKGVINGNVGDVEAAPSNWVKPYEIESGSPAHDNTEKGSDAVLVLGKPATDDSPAVPFKGSVPSRIVCIANVDDQTIIEKYANKSLAQLLEYNPNAATSKAPLHRSFYNNNEDRNFIMTSATYWDGADVIFWSNIETNNICANPELAQKNPVQIYIERLAAKVVVNSFPSDPRVKTTADEVYEFQYYYVDEASNQVRLSDPKIIMMEPIGWDLNNKCVQAYGIKHILKADGSGTSDYFANKEDFNLNGRSFWATTSSRNVFDQFVPNDLTNGPGETAYVMPNTRDPFLKGDGSIGVDNLRGRVNFAATYATKILFAARPHIVEPTAQEYTPGTGDQLMLWGGNYYTPEALCRVLENNNPGNVVVFCRITNPKDEDGHYKVRFYTLDNGIKDFKQRDITDHTTGLLPDDVEVTVLSDTPVAQYWNGMAYYIINISNKIHCTKGKDNGKEMYGVVRNTAYVYDLEGYIGMGTSVPVAEANTDVENPTISDSYVAAKLNILSWRLVTHDNVTLQ